MKFLAPLATLALVATFAVVGIAQSSIERGTLVLMKDSQNRPFVKVAVAVTGDVVLIADGRVTVNGTPSAIAVNDDTQWGPHRVAEGQLFVAGDPLQFAPDENAWGLIVSSMVVATVQPAQ